MPTTTPRYMTLIIVTGPTKTRSALATRAAGPPARYAGDKPGFPFHQPVSFNALVPIPPHLLRRRYTRRSRAGVKDSGRDWELANWGCPRGAIQSAASCHRGVLQFAVLTFVAPPNKFIESLARNYPTLSFRVVSVNTRSCDEQFSEFKAGERVAQPHGKRLKVSRK